MYRIKISLLVIAIFIFSFVWRESLCEGREKGAKLENIGVTSASGVAMGAIDWYLGMEKGFFPERGY